MVFKGFWWFQGFLNGLESGFLGWPLTLLLKVFFSRGGMSSRVPDNLCRSPKTVILLFGGFDMGLCDQKSFFFWVQQECNIMTHLSQKPGKD